MKKNENFVFYSLLSLVLIGSFFVFRSINESQANKATLVLVSAIEDEQKAGNFYLVSRLISTWEYSGLFSCLQLASSEEDNRTIYYDTLDNASCWFGRTIPSMFFFKKTIPSNSGKSFSVTFQIGSIWLFVTTELLSYLAILFVMLFLKGRYDRYILGKERDYRLSQFQVETIEKKNAQLGHDIVSPLTAIRIIIEKSNTDEGAKAILREALRRTEGIIDDLKDKSRVGNDIDDVNLTDLIKLIIDEKIISYPNYLFEFNAIAASIKGNKKELGRVLSNIINNAIESYVTAGTIRIAMSRGAGFVVISISDSGAGMDSETLARLGERGWTRGKHQGSGLGVYHAKKVIEMHSGSIKFDSKLGKGTTVSIAIPLS